MISMFIAPPVMYDPMRNLTEAMSVEDDGIRLLDDAPPSEVPGIRETNEPKRNVAKEVPPPLPEEILFENQPVMVHKGCLFQKTTGYPAWKQFAWTNYEYADEAMSPAVAGRYNGVPVFTGSSEDMQIFARLTEVFKLQLQAEVYQAIAFFVVPEGWMNVNGNNVHINRENVLGIAFDGKTAVFYRPGFQQTHHLRYSVGHPVQQAGDWLFKEVKNLIERSVHGVAKEIAAKKVWMQIVLNRQAEDIHLYLSDLPPLPGRETLHQHLIDVSASQYEQDQVTLAQGRAYLADREAAVKAARSQLPSGIKGKALRQGYLSAPRLEELLDGFWLERYGSDLQLHLHFRHQLKLEHEGLTLALGRPILRMKITPSRGSGREGTFIRHLEAESADYSAFVHPHLDGTRRWCLGTYVQPISQAFVGGNFPMVVALLWEYLNRYNPDSPLIRMDACIAAMNGIRPKAVIVRRK